MARENEEDSRVETVIDRLKALGVALTDLTERWVPDAWVIALILSLITFFAALLWGQVGPLGALQAWGQGLWALLTLMAQFSLTLIVAYAAAVSPPVARLLNWLGSRPNPEKPWQAILLMATFAFVTGWINWAFTIVVCAMFAPYIARNNPKVDWRLLVASAYLGIGTVWHAGLSGSATLIMATPDNFAIKAKLVEGVIPTTRTIFTAWNITVSLMVAVALTLLAALLSPPAHKARSLTREQADSLITFRTPERPTGRLRPSDAMNYWPGWNLMTAAAGFIYLGWWFGTKGLGALTIDIYNLIFLSFAVLLHWRPVSFLNACQEGARGVWGIILQFPFYAGIFGLVQFTKLGAALAKAFAALATPKTYAAVVFWYSGLVNYFIPSGGGQWVITSPFLLEAGRSLGLSDATVLLAYAWGDMMTDVIQPFWAIALLAVVRMKFGEIMGYCTLFWLLYIVVVTIAMFLLPLNL